MYWARLVAGVVFGVGVLMYLASFLVARLTHGSAPKLAVAS